MYNQHFPSPRTARFLSPVVWPCVKPIFGSTGERAKQRHEQRVKMRRRRGSGRERGRGFHHKNKILSLVDRTSGQAGSFVVDDVKAATLWAIVRENSTAKRTR